ncbi:MAG: DEAD/DEAH box helicase [Planctomycetota bacterium]
MTTATKVLRSHQAEGIDEARELFREGKKAVLVERATGAGKTVLAAEIFRLAYPRPCLFVAPRRVLVRQTEKAIRSWLDDAEPVAVEMAEQHGLSEADGKGPRITVASIQSLARRIEEGTIDPERFAGGVVVVDEVHAIALAERYRPVILALRDAGARLIGLTATPSRKDDGLEEVFDGAVEPVTVADAIKAGWLVKPKLFLRRLDADLGNVKRSHGDFVESELARELSTEKALASICRPIIDQIDDRHGLVFAAGADHAESIARVLCTMSGEPGFARPISYRTKERDRVALVEGLENRRYRLLVNPSLLSEGFDLPAISFIANARPTSSRVRHVQAVGRGLRASPGKTDCLVIEFHAKNLRHKLAGAWDLDASDGPADLGEFMAEIAEREADEGRAIALDDLRALAEIERAACRVAIVYDLARVDPLAAMGLDPETFQVQGNLVTRPTDKQAECLKRSGVKADQIAGLSRRSASKIIDVIVKRSQEGLSTLKQARTLTRHGFDGKSATFDQARDVLERIGGLGWHLSPIQVTEIAAVCGVNVRK